MNTQFLTSDCLNHEANRIIREHPRTENFSGHRPSDNGQPQQYHLRPFEEMIGPLTNIYSEGNDAIVTVGAYALFLPNSIGEQLAHHVGKWVSILRVDDPLRPYRFHVKDDDRLTVQTATGSPARTCIEGL